MDEDGEDDKVSTKTDNQSEQDFEFDFETIIMKCKGCNRKILGFLYQDGDDFRCSSCFHDIKGSRVDFSRTRYPGDKQQPNTAVIGFDKESYPQMKREPPSGDKFDDWCANKIKNGKSLANCFKLNFDDQKQFTATTTTFFSTKQNQDAPHGFFETSLIELKDDKQFSISIGFEGKQPRSSGSSSSKSHTPGCSKWGWTLTSNRMHDEEEEEEGQSSQYTHLFGWKTDDTVGVLCNFQEKTFSLYRNGIKEFRADIHWTGKFNMHPFVEASQCIVEICFDYDEFKYKPMEFSVVPGVPIPFEIFEWKRPCVVCESRLATHMYMCVGDDTACHKFVVCSACFHSGKELQCPHEQCSHWHSERVDFDDKQQKNDSVCIHCEQPFLKHTLLGGRHACPPDPKRLDTVWTFQSRKVEFLQHDNHKFFCLKTPFDVPNMDDPANLVDRRNSEPLFGELWTSPVDPVSELKMKLLSENFESDSSKKQKIGVVVATDSLCESGCTTKHTGYCVRCSKHFKFHRFARLCKDGELSRDFGPTNDFCSRCSHSVGNHTLVHLCLDDGVGRFHKDPNDQRIFIAAEDLLYVERRGRISRLVPDPGPHYHRHVASFFRLFSSYM